ncbi:hypothetical protein L195_g008345 [Trifolium pratense]|uniref:Uncharacterized protein n=1 Tax=Trifolium pratense TaxID=57577 RepID=A0A2K3P8W6_TRIPR|nr:hypothetical protein L195_g008345 [Trifolium pratense]
MEEVIEPRLRNYNNVKSVLFDICRTESVTTAGTIAMIAWWCLWQNRNSWVWNGVKNTTKDVALRAVHTIGEWRAVNRVQQQNSVAVTSSAQRHRSATAESFSRAVQHGTEQVQCQRPRDGWLKCNVISQSSSTTGWGWCLRNYVLT